MAMYSQSGGKSSTHAWLSDSTSIGAISYLVVQTYEYAYHRNFRTVHQRNATLHVGTYALLPSDRFLRILTATPTLSQDGRTLTVEDTDSSLQRAAGETSGCSKGSESYCSCTEERPKEVGRSGYQCRWDGRGMT